jgi:hypothetical protein
MESGATLIIENPIDSRAMKLPCALGDLIG